MRKKDGRQRMILDCRCGNRMFRDPARTNLITGEGLSEIEILDDSFITSGLGVDAYFHRLRLLGANRSKVDG